MNISAGHVVHVLCSSSTQKFSEYREVQVQEIDDVQDKMGLFLSQTGCGWCEITDTRLWQREKLLVVKEDQKNYRETQPRRGCDNSV